MARQASGLPGFPVTFIGDTNWDTIGTIGMTHDWTVNWHWTHWTHWLDSLAMDRHASSWHCSGQTLTTSAKANRVAKGRLFPKHWKTNIPKGVVMLHCATQEEAKRCTACGELCQPQWELHREFGVSGIGFAFQCRNKHKWAHCVPCKDVLDTKVLDTFTIT